MSKWTAAGLHLAISAVVGGIIFILIKTVLYPGALFEAMGIWNILALVLLVDVTIGPLLTWIVFKPKKPSLKFDLSVIACAQLLALVAGLNTIWEGRPAIVAYLGHRFDVIQASEIPQENLDAASSAQRPAITPRWVQIVLPKDEATLSKILDTSLAGVDYGHYPQFHENFQKVVNGGGTQALPVIELELMSPQLKREIDTWMKDNEVDKATAKFLGLKAKARDMAVVFDPISGKVYGIAPFIPWRQ
jgi:hypothetical protein